MRSHAARPAGHNMSPKSSEKRKRKCSEGEASSSTDVAARRDVDSDSSLASAGSAGVRRSPRKKSGVGPGSAGSAGSEPENQGKGKRSVKVKFCPSGSSGDVVRQCPATNTNVGVRQSPGRKQSRSKLVEHIEHSDGRRPPCSRGKVVKVTDADRLSSGDSSEKLPLKTHSNVDDKVISAKKSLFRPSESGDDVHVVDKDLKEITPHRGSSHSASKVARVAESDLLSLGNTSDGISFEGQSDDDLPNFNMESPSKRVEFEKNDIIWAPFGKVFWPALVTSVKLPNVCFLYVNYDSGTKVFRKHFKLLFPFDNPSKNQELKEMAVKAACRGFNEAYTLVIKYLILRKKNSKIHARRFLTPSKIDDKVMQAKECLFRLTGSFDGEDNSEDEDVEENDEKSVGGHHEDDFNMPRSEHEAKVKEILNDLETVPPYMTVSREEEKQLKKEANQLLSAIQSKGCFQHLMKIREGSISCSRHSKFHKQEFVRSGLGPFTLFPELISRLLTIIDDYCDDYDTTDYKQSVMLPEAIVYAIKKIKKCSRRDAQRHFRVMSKKVGVND